MKRFGTALLIIIPLSVAVYQSWKRSQARREFVALQRQHEALAAELATIRREKDEAKAQHGTNVHKIEEQTAELIKLRGELAALKASATQKRAVGSEGLNTSDPFISSVLSLVQRASDIREHLERMPEKAIPELHWLTENDWLTAAKTADLTSEIGIRQTLKQLRRLAKERLYPIWQKGLESYAAANNGALPGDMLDLKAYLEPPVDDAILSRYKLLRTGQLRSYQPGDWLIAEKQPVDREYDTRFKMGWGASTISATGLNQVPEQDY